MFLDTAIDLTQPSAVQNEVQGPFTSPGAGITLILQAIMILSALMVLIFLVWGAIEWITSGGEKGKVEAARHKMTQAVVGLFILAGSVALFTLIQTILGINLHLGDTTAGAINPPPGAVCIPANSCHGPNMVCQGACGVPSATNPYCYCGTTQ